MTDFSKILAEIRNKNTLSVQDYIDNQRELTQFFDSVINESNPTLPFNIQLIYDAVDEFVFQFRSCNNDRERNATSDKKNELFDSNPELWRVRNTVKQLRDIIVSSKIVSTLKEGGENQLCKLLPKKNSSQNTDAKTLSASTSSAQNKLALGYFAIIGLGQIYTLIGDYALALDTFSWIDTTRKISDSVWSRILACRVALFYFIGVCYLMLERYIDAQRYFSQLLIFFQTKRQVISHNAQYRIIQAAQQQQSSSSSSSNTFTPIIPTPATSATSALVPPSYQSISTIQPLSTAAIVIHYIAHAPQLQIHDSPVQQLTIKIPPSQESLIKRCDKVTLLLAICQAVTQQRIDDLLTHAIKERYSDKFSKMQHGEGTDIFSQSFLAACPKFVSVGLDGVEQQQQQQQQQQQGSGPVISSVSVSKGQGQQTSPSTSLTQSKAIQTQLSLFMQGIRRRLQLQRISQLVKPCANASLETIASLYDKPEVETKPKKTQIQAHHEIHDADAVQQELFALRAQYSLCPVHDDGDAALSLCKFVGSMPVEFTITPNSITGHEQQKKLQVQEFVSSVETKKVRNYNDFFIKNSKRLGATQAVLSAFLKR
ncbi:MAG: putative Eukaryotic translation initiation factor 3 subunit L [Streblomastix strix]|uniref:Putative Eukaryotic translation initiation factor 3 subunit L n=1 Tax=Streblomastix strix TaxID=222440 RepID=A0A5J4W382_9EUKA|nr:MAG: putative Eukaryotic translation initiation factor 3 subunit L [Streblomastix strix]